MYLKKLGVICLILFSGFAFGNDKKIDTTYSMDEVVIKSSRLNDFAIGSSIQKIKAHDLKLFTSQSFADLLAARSLVLINSYGPGGLSNPSIRGGGSSHSAVIWNGVSIQSPMNGGVNTALIPAGFVNNVNIQYGGSGTLYGSGAVSGIIHLGEDNLFALKNNVLLNASYGSFNTKNVLFGLKYGNQNIAASFKYYFADADNDFEFKKEDESIFEQTNAGMKQHAFMGKSQVRTGLNSVLKAEAWYQEYDKNIQTTLNATGPSAATQDNTNLRTAVKWDYRYNNFALNIKSVYLNEKIEYLDPAYMSVPNKNIGQSLINEAEAKYLINENHSIIGGLNYTLEDAESGDYTDDADRKRLSAFVSYKIQNLFDRLTIVNSVRQEVVDSDYIPLVFSSGLDFKIIDPVNFVFNISKTYNNPSLNDLYWVPGAWTAGNPDLKAEYGWSGDLGLKEYFKLGSVDIEFKQNFFWNNINDWIIWLPNEEFVWMPDNKRKGKTKGFDVHLNANWKLNKSQLSFNALYTYTKSVFEELENDVIVEKETIYVPKHQFSLNLNYECKSWSFDLSQNYYGKRLYNVDEDPLSDFMIFNASASFKLPIKNQSLVASFKVQNLGNKYYQVINNYAMPGRNFKFSLHYTLNFD